MYNLRNVNLHVVKTVELINIKNNFLTKNEKSDIIGQYN